MNILKKISTKNVCGDIKGMVASGDIKKNCNVMRVYGVCVGAKIESGDKGDYIKFTGQFEAVNLLTGEAYSAPIMFLPDVVANLIAGAIMQESVNELKFGFDIGIRLDKELIVGYEFTAKPLIEPDEQDALADLRSTLPALPSPKK